MRVEGSAQSVNGFSAISDLARANALGSPGVSAPGAIQDSVKLSALEPEAAEVSGMPSMISANAGDALAAHSRLDPERAMRLLEMLGA